MTYKSNDLVVLVDDRSRVDVVLLEHLHSE